MHRFHRTFIFLFALPCFGQTGNPAITTGQYNTTRTSANLNEAILNTSNVSQSQFGKLYSFPVDGGIFAQPLYVPGVQIGGAVKNVLFVATMHNSIYAFDADSSSTTPLWKISQYDDKGNVVLGPSVPAPSGNGCPSYGYSGPELGILSTPVIDLSSNTLYAVAANPSGNGFMHWLHAIDITTGTERPNSPVEIQPSVPSHGSYDQSGGYVTLNSNNTDVQRTALLLANGSVYAGFGNCGPDNDFWHGWVVGYDESTLKPTLTFNSTPNSGEGGIWQSGRGLMADPAGNLWFTTGNTQESILKASAADDASDGNLPMRLIQLSPSGSFLGSYPPANYYDLNQNDLDFSSSGPLFIPGTNKLVAGGKDGILYLFDAGNPSTPLQSFQATGSGSSCSYSGNGCFQIRDLAYWNSNLYVWGSNDHLRSYPFSNGQFNTNASVSGDQVGFYAAELAVSASGNTPGTGILWAMTDGAPNGRSMLRAFDASGVTNELWNSEQNGGRDSLPAFSKFVEPTVVNGRVYAPAGTQVTVYGVLSDFTLSTSANQVSVYQGNSTGVTATVTALGGFQGAVNLSISGLPSGATAAFAPASVNGSGSSSLTITTTSSTPTGQATVTIAASTGTVTRSTTLTLNVTTPDTTPPAWSCCTSTVSGAVRTLYFSGWDTGSGLASIKVLAQVNSTVVIPGFTTGTNNPVTFSETQSGWSSYVQFQLADVAGNTTTIDPCMIDTGRSAGKPVAYPCEDKTISRAEHLVTVMNGTPGVKNLRIDVNGTPFQVAGLKDNETRVVDIGSALRDSGNTTDAVPLGKPGGSVWVIFCDSPITPTK